MSADVTTIFATATIGGVARDVEQVSIDREIATDLPEQVTGGGGIEKATGTVELTDPTDTGVVVERRSPWTRTGGWPPERAEVVTIDAAMDGDASSRRFTGRVSEVSGAATDGAVTVSIEDLTDDLMVPFSHEPMHETMPPLTDTGDMRRVGLRADYYADVAMRRAGFNTTPRGAGNVALEVPAQGSMWPMVGEVTASGEISNPTGQPNFHPAPWGWCVSNTEATYSRDVPWSIGNGALCVGLMVAPDHAAQAAVTVRLGSTGVTVRVTAQRRVIVTSLGGATWTDQSPPGDWTRVEIMLQADRIILRSDTGWQHETMRDLSGLRTRVYDSTQIVANSGARVGGVVVQFTPASYGGAYVTSPLNATMLVGNLLAPIACMPALTPEDGLELLREISEALVISMWIDRAGHLWWVHPDVLRDQPPAATLTADADLLDLAWQDGAAAARRSVEVEYRQPVAKRRKQARITVWEGGGDNLAQGETAEEIITPPADIDWIMLADLDQTIYCTPYPSNPAALPDFNRGIGSWIGGTHLDAGGDSPATRIKDSGSLEWTATDNYPSMHRTLEQIGPQAWKLTAGLVSQSDKTWREIQQALDPVPRVEPMPGMGSRINGSWSGQKMPVLRAKGITTWDDASVVSTITGPAGYEELVHDTGPWAGGGARALADWIARQVTTPSPILRDLPIIYRTDLDLGDVIDVVEDSTYHVRLRVMIVALSEQHDEAESTMTLTARVLSAEPTRLTYTDQAAMWAGRTYAALAAAGGTYDSREDA